MIANLFLQLLACDEPELGCTGALLVYVDNDASDIILRSDLTLTGTAAQTDGFAIRRILVGGIAAENEGFNFDSWRAVVPLDVLLASATREPDAATGKVPLEVRGVDACGDPSAPVSLEVTVDLTPDVVIANGALEVTLAPVVGEDYLPADGSEIAEVEVCAPADAVDVGVTLQSSQGTFLGTLPGDEVVLEAGDCGAIDGEDVSAVATAWFAPTSTSSTAFVTASGGGATASEQVDVAPAPELLPSSMDLVTGQTVVVQALVSGRLRSCSAYGADPAVVQVLLDGDPALSLYDVALVDDAELGQDHTVTVSAKGPAPASVSVVCCDTFDQCSEPAVYTMAP